MRKPQPPQRFPTMRRSDHRKWSRSAFVAGTKVGYCLIKIPVAGWQFITHQVSLFPAVALTNATAAVSLSFFSLVAANNGGQVQVNQILVEIDNEIARLQEARNLLAGGSVRGAKRGKAAVKRASSKRKMSTEGRRRIAEAMKRRWAERRKEASGKNARAAKAA